MNKQEFECILNACAGRLTQEAQKNLFTSPSEFEKRVREIIHEYVKENPEVEIDFNPHPHGFPDIAVGEFGVEVKFTLNDTWRSVGNSVLETNRIDSVLKIYLMFGKMGGTPEVRWGEYDKSIVHVRTSHVPRFEVEINPEKSLFDFIETTYEEFHKMPMDEKMKYIRKYARDRLKKGERLWWLEDVDSAAHSLPIQARLYTSLVDEEKIKLRAEASLLCPSIVRSGRSKNKYDDVVLYLLTYHGVLCHQARDLFSAGSVANPKNDDDGGLYIKRAIKSIEHQMFKAAEYMDDSLFVEYWGESVLPENRIKKWLEMADKEAGGAWKPSDELFINI